MPTQQEIQQQAQEWVPNSGLGGGNPNTAYNNPPIPMTDAFGNWTTPTVKPAASYTPSTLPVRQVTLTPANFPQVTPVTPSLDSGWTFNPGIPTTGGVAVPTPTGTGGSQWGIQQPGNTGTSGAGGTGTQPSTGAPAAGGGGGAWNFDLLNRPLLEERPEYRMGTVTYDNFGNPTYDFTNLNKEAETAGSALISNMQDPEYRKTLPPKVASVVDKALNFAGLNMKNPDGTIDWRQVADVVTELAGIRGDIWLSGSQEWDVSNGVMGLLQSVTGLPANKIANAIGNKAIQNHDGSIDLKDYPWYSRWAADHVIDNRNNALISRGNETGNWQWGNSKLDNNLITKYFEDTYNQLYGETPVPTDESNPWLREDLPGVTVGRLDETPEELAARSRTGSIDWGDMYNPWAGGGGCVVVDSFVYDMPVAGELKVGMTMPTIDPNTLEFGEDEISYAEKKLMPCVEVTTENGVRLRCSTTAPIADKDGNQVLAPDLLGVEVLTKNGNWFEVSKVIEVQDIGLHTVMHITCGNKFFLAGAEEGMYLLHHNMKANTWGMTDAQMKAWRDYLRMQELQSEGI